jgi:hypothetical protein
MRRFGQGARNRVMDFTYAAGEKAGVGARVQPGDTGRLATAG